MIRGHEPTIRRVIFHITTFARIEDPRCRSYRQTVLISDYRLQAMMTQLLSNLISPVSDESRHTDQLLAIYLGGKREDDVISRLLDSRDQGTNIATLHLLNNITRASPTIQ
jgi:ataxin-10